jgi:3-(3-hydroxy-phenyl)propionate hydroxylase
MASERHRVLIAGGGPVGLLAAYLLARRGVAVRVFDVNETLQDDPRAATTHPATLDLLGEAGLVDDMARVGLTAPIFQFWDRPSGEKVAEFDHALLENDTRHPFVIQCEQFKTTRILLDRLKGMANAEVLFGHEVTGMEQDERSVTVEVNGKRHRGAYLIGADGGRSTVRKSAGISFDGFTWPERFIVLTTTYDFARERGYCPRSYFADPEQWCNCFKVAADGPPGLWRTVFPTDPDASDDALMSDEGVQGSASHPSSAKAASCSRATPPMSITRSAGWDSTAASRMRSPWPTSWPACSAARTTGCSTSTICNAAPWRSNSSKRSRLPTSSSWRRAIRSCG